MLVGYLTRFPGSYAGVIRLGCPQQPREAVGLKLGVWVEDQDEAGAAFRNRLIVCRSKTDIARVDQHFKGGESPAVAHLRVQKHRNRVVVAGVVDEGDANEANWSLLGEAGEERG